MIMVMFIAFFTSLMICCFWDYVLCHKVSLKLLFENSLVSLIVTIPTCLFAYLIIQ